MSCLNQDNCNARPHTCMWAQIEAIMPGNVKFQITLYFLKFQQAAQLEKWKLSPR